MHVQLTVDNVFAQYFYDHFGLSLSKSGDLAAVFGLFNIFSRASGGFLSDFVARYYGMRGRLWTHWIIATSSGMHPSVAEEEQAGATHACASEEVRRGKGRGGHLFLSSPFFLVFPLFEQRILLGGGGREEHRDVVAHTSCPTSTPQQESRDLCLVPELRRIRLKYFQGYRAQHACTSARGSHTLRP